MHRPIAQNCQGWIGHEIIAPWQDPTTSKLYLFHSFNIWFDPSDYVTRERVTVLVDRANFKRCSMDLAFLPALAD